MNLENHRRHTFAAVVFLITDLADGEGLQGFYTSNLSIELQNVCD
jgi:hypothetical protein